MKRRVAAGLLVVMGLIAGLGVLVANESGAATNPDTVAWARQVCAKALPATRRLEVELRVSTELLANDSGRPEDAVARVRAAERLFARLADTLESWRAGFRAAKPPRVAGARASIRDLVRRLGNVVSAIDVVRGAARDYLVAGPGEEMAAAEAIRVAIREDLSSATAQAMPPDWPDGLRSALAKAPTCQRITSTIEGALGSG